MKRNFSVKALWDEEAKTIEEFEEILDECAVELIVENHHSTSG